MFLPGAKFGISKIVALPQDRGEFWKK